MALLGVVIVDVLIHAIADVPNVLFDPVDGVFHAGSAVRPELPLHGVLRTNEPYQAGK